MRSALFLQLLLTLVGIARSGVWAQNSTDSIRIIDVDDFPCNTLDATAWALIYTYPLVVFASWAGGVFQHVGSNQIYHQRTLATPTSPGVIKPNEDTLYSRAVLDLSSHDIVLTVPEINDGRYWVYPVYDPYALLCAYGKFPQYADPNLAMAM